jgi:hypothetical protein
MKMIMAVIALSVLIMPADVLAGDAPCNKKFVIEALDSNMQSESMTCLVAMIEKSPSNGWAHCLLGEIYLKRGSYSAAAEHLTDRSALKQCPLDIADWTEAEFKLQLGEGNMSRAGQAYLMIPGNNRDLACREFYGRAKSASDDRSFFLYQVTREFCGSTYDRESADRFLAVAEKLPVDERKPWLRKASHFSDWDYIHKKFPPPTEETVFSRTYEGKGVGEDDKSIKVPGDGQHVLAGDTVIITGEEFWVADGSWKKFQERARFETGKINPGGWTVLQAEEGMPLTVEVIRGKRSY